NVFSSVQFSRSVVSDSLQPHRLQSTRLPCPSLSPGVCSNSCPVLCETLEYILCFAPPFLEFYLVFTWGTQASEKSKRKNPAAYANDK
ncbi:hypothetical protein K5549_021785, partial [Capra hircus]